MKGKRCETQLIFHLIKMSENIVNVFDKIFKKYNLNLNDFIDNYGKPEFDYKIKKLKQKVKAFHIFDDINGLNAFLIKSDDKVFSFGSTHFGCCGYRHNIVVNEPQIIPE